MFLEIACCAHACPCLLWPDYRSSWRGHAWAACMLEDLENARGALHQDSPLRRERCTCLYVLGRFCVPLDSCSYQEFTGTSQDTLLRPSKTGSQAHCSLEQDRGEKSSHSSGTVHPAVQGLPCTIPCSDLAALWVTHLILEAP